jgi:hypothetical protein
MGPFSTSPHNGRASHNICLHLNFEFGLEKWNQDQKKPDQKIFSASRFKRQFLHVTGSGKGEYIFKRGHPRGHPRPMNKKSTYRKNP